MKRLLKTFLPLVDWLISPLTVLSSGLLLFIRRAGIGRMHVSRKLFRMIGVFPIRDHYYDPLFNPKWLTKPLSDVRDIPALDLNTNEQMVILRQFQYRDELAEFPMENGKNSEYCYHNFSFGPGDAEYLYSMVRFYKPRRVVEIGSGNSTLVVMKAIERNRKEDSRYECMHTCIEPYEAEWLERAGIRVIRERVERLGTGLFAELERNDILFIDSSHVIKPQGDVLFEYMEVLPALKPGVFVHIHDIYTPRDYPETCVVDNVRLWNEQYLLESFLMFNAQFRIIGALNHLKHTRFDELARACPVLATEPWSEPGSFWIVKN